MGIFGFGSRGKSGGMMNAIRCDEEEYLVWKWRPLGEDANTTSRENAIRYGSSLSVKDGEVAVFVYRPQGGGQGGQDFIEGPYQDTVKTANLPVLASIVGLAYGGETPFQAEVYYVNLQETNQIRFGVPYFDVSDPRNMDLVVPVAVRGVLTFGISDYRAFVKKNRLRNFTLDQFCQQIKAALTKYVKGVVTNIPTQYGIPLVRIETQILEVNDIVQQYIAPRLANDFGVDIRALDISHIEIDKDTEAYRTLKAITQDISVHQVKQQADIALRTADAQAEASIKNIHDTQRINTQNMEQTLRIQREQMNSAQNMMRQEKQRALQAETEMNRKAQAAMIDETARAMKAKTESMAAAWDAQTLEAQRSGRMRTQTAYPQANILDKQTQMLGTTAQAMASGGTGINLGGGGGTAVNPGGMMAGMAMGNALGQQVAGMMGQMGGAMQGAMQTPPEIPQTAYHVAAGGQTYGPYTTDALRTMVAQGQVTPQTMVWTQGMPTWAAAATRPDLAELFMPAAPQGGMPPLPGSMPPTPPTPPTL